MFLRKQIVQSTLASKSLLTKSTPYKLGFGLRGAQSQLQTVQAMSFMTYGRQN